MALHDQRHRLVGLDGVGSVATGRGFRDGARSGRAVERVGVDVVHLGEAAIA